VSLSLEEALGQVDLRPGQTYVCEVNGHTIEVRVGSNGRRDEAPPIPEGDVMLDAWAEFPEPPAAGTVTAKLGSPELFLPDRPVIPEDEDVE
jgi:hypothetical protein